MNKGGANLNSLGTTLKKCRRFEKIIKICGAYNKKHCVKKLWKYIYICGRYGRKSNFAPPWKKPWKFNVLFCPIYFFGTVQICPMDSIISSSVSNPTPLVVRQIFFLTFWKKLFFSCNFLGYLGPKTHFKQLFFLWFSKSNLFFLSRVQRSGAEHWWWERCAPWKMVGQIWTLEIVKKKY